ncbi:related to Proline dehydrogenase, mitochondrial [Saccharomycodes ludwigii]|uniref:Proline dehydrogenase n=1 Tax=Saccharomycodes ludwigii TaxID=36035 RepID=A0A376B3Y6_9ASCO|nr:hypothetical protein SCDLUD_001791 [Saccharomycodes ludwigii]KAH3902003.1 hypothetical protein SCDLUD_001791 [Saccharomycodes ludwigii]SSD59387.1 related to Proline dehydrogenase, mitochondrial [Saccharomycodes ludwigii]
MLSYTMKTSLVNRNTLRLVLKNNITKKHLASTLSTKLLVSNGQMRYVSQSIPSKKPHEVVTLTSNNSSEQHPGHQEAPISDPSNAAYLKTLSKSELISLAMIGFCSINKPMLDLVIKVFPYVPLFLIKLFVYKLYCGGANFKEVVQTGKNLQKRGINNMMLSLTMEDSEGTKNIDINYIVDETIRSIKEILDPNLEQQLVKASSVEEINDIPPGYIALKPSALVSNPAQVLLNFNNPEWKSQREELIKNCSKITQVVYDLNKELSLKYPQRKSPFFISVIDAEKYDLQKAGVYELQRILFEKFNPQSEPMISCAGTWQLYLVDSTKDLQKEYERASKNGYKLGVKIVRGAYIHSEAKRSTIIQPTKEATDLVYDKVMKQIINDLLQKGEKSTYGHLVIASHNYKSQLIASEMLHNISSNNSGKSNIVLGQLLGMADNVTYDLIHNHGAKNIIKYVPWGPPLETKDYLLRRLQENGDAVRADNGWPLVKSVFKTLFSS